MPRSLSRCVQIDVPTGERHLDEEEPILAPKELFRHGPRSIRRGDDVVGPQDLPACLCNECLADLNPVTTLLSGRTEEDLVLLILHGYGNVFERTLKAGESIMLEPGAFLYKDSTVTMNVHMQKLTSGFLGGVSMSLAEMVGPGRVGIQSMYVHHHTD